MVSDIPALIQRSRNAEKKYRCRYCREGAYPCRALYALIIHRCYCLQRIVRSVGAAHRLILWGVSVVGIVVSSVYIAEIMWRNL